MEFQGEREPGVLEIDVMLESMAQDEIPEQDIPIGMQVDNPPQPDPEPEMGAAAEAAVDDTPPSHLRQSPSPAPSETATNNGGSVQLEPSVIAQLMLMMQAMNADMQQALKYEM